MLCCTLGSTALVPASSPISTIPCFFSLPASPIYVKGTSSGSSLSWTHAQPYLGPLGQVTTPAHQDLVENPTCPHVHVCNPTHAQDNAYNPTRSRVFPGKGGIDTVLENMLSDSMARIEQVTQRGWCGDSRTGENMLSDSMACIEQVTQRGWAGDSRTGDRGEHAVRLHGSHGVGADSALGPGGGEREEGQRV